MSDMIRYKCAISWEPQCQVQTQLPMISYLRVVWPCNFLMK